jgi:Saxitoxin biosynthesis operon protein SxtJ
MRWRSLTGHAPSPLGEQHHESLAADGAAPLPSDRSVGFVFAAAATVTGVVPWIRGGSPRFWALAAAAGLLLITLTRSRWLHPLNRAWMAVGSVANIVGSSVLMALIFYGVITPLAWVLRRTGLDPLRLRFDPGAASYWLERRPPGPAPETMKNQF